MTSSHADPLGRLKVAVWQEVYAGLMDARFLAGLTAEQSAGSWRELLERPWAGVRLVALAPGGELVGFGVAGPPQDDDPPTDWQLFALNLLPDARGTGVADLLMEALVGTRDAALWVASGNQRAVAFYRAYGFELDGTEQCDDQFGVTELRMLRRATAPP